MDDELEELKKKLLKTEISTSEMKIAAIDDALKSGTIEKKINLILIDIQAREREKLSQNKLKLDY